MLTEDLSSISDWLKENELIINLKKGKTEALLFGTSKKVANHLEDFEIYVNDTKITFTKQYKYLGVPVDSSLNMNSFFDTCYKKASSRLNLLAKLRHMLDIDAARYIYHCMILPTFTYCGLHLLHLTISREYKLASFHRRAERIVNAKDIRSVTNANKKRACIFVKSCLEGEVIDPFINYFKLSSHNKNTRNNSKIIQLPLIKREYARKGFYFTGAKVFNMLPLEGRRLDKIKFVNFVDKYFK